jgi:flagellar hook-basal body complex protein FliE
VIPPVSSLGGSQWSVGNVGGLDQLDVADTGAATSSTGAGAGFGSILANQLGALSSQQQAASAASRSLADGTATDPETAVMAVERAQLSMQLASQLRTKGVEALSDLFHTSV